MSENKLKVGDIIRCKDWQDMRRTMLELAAEGYFCEIKGWEQMQTNTLTITGVPEEFSDYEGMPYQFDNMTGSMNL